MFCSCFGRKRKTSGIPIDKDAAVKDTPQNSCKVEIQKTPTQAERNVPVENGGTASPNKSQTLNGRKLPEIPHNEERSRDPVTDISLDMTRPHSQNAVEKQLLRTASISKNANNSQSSPDLHVYELEEPLASLSLPKLNCPSPKKPAPKGDDYEANEAARPHPYERLIGHPQEDNYDDPQTYSMPTPRQRHTHQSPAWYTSNGNMHDTMPPLVPAKNLTAEELCATHEPSTSAATAVAGRHFSDIPFMTSPERNSREEPDFEDSNETEGGKQVISYTSISVRESIKNVLANAAAKPVPKPRTCKISEEQEAFYSTVPEDADADQTYAVIESARSSAALLGSPTYAHVSKPAPIDETKEPPEPPTLESLKNVAHAHSRQTSSSSMKNLAHTQPPTTGLLDPYSDNPYGSREHHLRTDSAKKSRNTVHVMDTDTLDGMYAKIQKKKGAASGDSNLQSPTNRASSIVIQTQPLPQEPVEPTTNRIAFRRESSTVDPGYERISGGRIDETVGSNADVNLDADADVGVVGYESIRSAVGSSEDPGYARVVDNESEILDPTYESVARRSSLGSSDPGYWKIRTPEEDLGDHLYEHINNRKKEEEEEEDEEEGEEEEEEPNYDRIVYAAGNDTDEEDEPAYEKVHRKPVPRFAASVTTASEVESETFAERDRDIDIGTEEIQSNTEIVNGEGNGDIGDVRGENKEHSVSFVTSNEEDSSAGHM